jgi:hypothetical protein
MAERRSSRRRAPEPESGTDSHNDSYDADSLESDPRERGKGRGPEGLSRLRTSAPSTSRRENVRVWPLCFAIAIEKTVRVRPAVMVASSSLLAWVTYYLQESDLELTLRAWISSPLVVFILVECLFLLCAFFVLMPHTMRQAYKDDKRTAFKVADSAVLSALPPSVARFAVGRARGGARRRAVLHAVPPLRGGARGRRGRGGVHSRDEERQNENDGRGEGRLARDGRRVLGALVGEVVGRGRGLDDADRA